MPKNHCLRKRRYNWADADLWQTHFFCKHQHNCSKTYLSQRHRAYRATAPQLRPEAFCTAPATQRGAAPTERPRTPHRISFRGSSNCACHAKRSRAHRGTRRATAPSGGFMSCACHARRNRGPQLLQEILFTALATEGRPHPQSKHALQEAHCTAPAYCACHAKRSSAHKATTRAAVPWLWNELCVRCVVWKIGCMWDEWCVRWRRWVVDEMSGVRWVVCEVSCVRWVVWDELCVMSCVRCVVWWVVWKELCGVWVLCWMSCVRWIVCVTWVVAWHEMCAAGRR